MPVVTIGRQFGAGGTSVGEMLARELHADLLESRIIDEVAQHLQLRSEEHTSELQSPCNLVCRLLLEKKKKHHHARQSRVSTSPNTPPATKPITALHSSTAIHIRHPPSHC